MVHPRARREPNDHARIPVAVVRERRVVRVMTTNPHPPQPLPSRSIAHPPRAVRRLRDGDQPDAHLLARLFHLFVLLLQRLGARVSPRRLRGEPRHGALAFSEFLALRRRHSRGGGQLRLPRAHEFLPRLHLRHRRRELSSERVHLGVGVGESSRQRRHHLVAGTRTRAGETPPSRARPPEPPPTGAHSVAAAEDSGVSGVSPVPRAKPPRAGAKPRRRIPRKDAAGTKVFSRAGRRRGGTGRDGGGRRVARRGGVHAAFVRSRVAARLVARRDAHPRAR